jgi:hypothetical protein
MYKFNYVHRAVWVLHASKDKQTLLALSLISIRVVISCRIWQQRLFFLKEYSLKKNRRCCQIRHAPLLERMSLSVFSRPVHRSIPCFPVPCCVFHCENFPVFSRGLPDVHHINYKPTPNSTKQKRV